MENIQLRILAVGRDPAILQVVERLINGHEGWAATIVTTDEDAIAAVDTTDFRIVFVCAGVTVEEEENLRRKIQELRPGAVVTRHFGGGSGLLENEVLAILNS
jgi:DNA-binding response OmpR family regulator